MNVTPTQNIVCASISFTIGSLLCVGGILLQALSCCDRFIIPQQHFADKSQVSGGLCQHFSLLLSVFSFSSTLLFPSCLHLKLFIALCLSACWFVFFFSLYVCVSMTVFLSLTLSEHHQKRTSRVHHRNEKTVSRHTGVVILVRRASTVIYGLLPNVSLDQKLTSEAH